MKCIKLPLPSCSECSGEILLLAKSGRTREYRRGIILPIPEHIEIPTCNDCGEEFMIPEVSEVLDPILHTEFLNRFHNVT